jgi:GAF domain-containing protein
MSEDPGRRRLARTAGQLGEQVGNRALLQAVVETARAIFDAEAATVLLLDESSKELVFEAVSGHGEKELLGRRLPARAGVAGSVLMSGEAIVVDDVTRDPRFAREAAESLGYMPTSLMAVPLIVGDDTLGVLEVLDPSDRSRPPLKELELLGRFADQAAIALGMLRSARRVQDTLTGQQTDMVALARLALRLNRLEGDKRDAAAQLLEALTRLLA